MSDPWTPSRSYRPGEWYAVVADDLVVVLPPTARAEAAAVWAEVEDGADADAVLDRLLASGLRGLAGLALVDTSEGCRVVVRGEARCSARGGGDDLDLDGARVRTWVEGTLESVDELVLELGEPVDGAPDLPVLRGLVGVSRLDLPARHAASGSSGAAAAAAVPPALVADTGPDTGDSLEEDADDAAERVSRYGGPQPMVAPVVPLPGPRAVGDQDDLMTEAFAIGSLDDEDDGLGHHAGDDTDDDTDEDAGDDTGENPGESTGEIVGQDTDDAVPVPLSVRFSHGELRSLDHVLVVGRGPDLGRSSDPSSAEAIRVPSPQQEISSTHLELRPPRDGGPALVVDLGSTNGTVLVVPGASPETLLPGVPAPLHPGAMIDLGDGLTITAVEG